MGCSDMAAIRRPGILGHEPGTGAGSAGYATTWAQPSSSGRSTRLRPVDLRAVGLQHRQKHSHLSQMLNKIRCGSCGGMGCGACAGTGATGLCGDPGCSLGAGHGHGKGTGCGLCGGKGCAKLPGGAQSLECTASLPRSRACSTGPRSRGSTGPAGRSRSPRAMSLTL